MSIFKAMSHYERKREAYIRELEADNKRLRADVNKWMDLALAADAAADRNKLTAILAGAYDRKKEGT